MVPFCKFKPAADFVLEPERQFVPPTVGRPDASDEIFDVSAAIIPEKIAAGLPM